jgi:hypothetical protein
MFRYLIIGILKYLNTSILQQAKKWKNVSIECVNRSITQNVYIECVNRSITQNVSIECVNRSITQNVSIECVNRSRKSS